MGMRIFVGGCPEWGRPWIMMIYAVIVVELIDWHCLFVVTCQIVTKWTAIEMIFVSLRQYLILIYFSSYLLFSPFQVKEGLVIVYKFSIYSYTHPFWIIKLNKARMLYCKVQVQMQWTEGGELHYLINYYCRWWWGGVGAAATGEMEERIWSAVDEWSRCNCL